MSAVQLPLGIRLDDGATFRNYLAGTNAEALHLARAALNGRERFVYFWGGPGTGKTHLLQALCHEAAQCGAPTAYLPFAHKDELAPELLEGMEHLAAVCCDDVQCIAGHGAWERALFDLYNRVRESGAALVMTGSAPPPRLGIRLADLQSRLGWGRRAAAWNSATKWASFCCGVFPATWVACSRCWSVWTMRRGNRSVALRFPSYARSSVRDAGVIDQ